MLKTFPGLFGCFLQSEGEITFTAVVAEVPFWSTSSFHAAPKPRLMQQLIRSGSHSSASQPDETRAAVVSSAAGKEKND